VKGGNGGREPQLPGLSGNGNATVVVVAAALRVSDAAATALRIIAAGGTTLVLGGDAPRQPRARGTGVHCAGCVSCIVYCGLWGRGVVGSRRPLN